MTYLVTENCIKCKYTDCVDVCPVDCFYEGKNMLVINPDECIDCGVCEPECPAEAISGDNDVKFKTPEGKENLIKWLEINKKYASEWPGITRTKNPPEDADQHLNLNNKYEKYFAENLKENA